MNQIIGYIYEYKGSKKIHNCGFLKIQFHYHKLLVQIHLKGLALTNSEALELFIFYKDGENIVTKKLLNLPVKNKNINMQFSLLDHFFPEKSRLQECDGFLLRGPYGEIYAATWMNVTIDTEKIDTPKESSFTVDTAPVEAEGTEDTGMDEADMEAAEVDKMDMETTDTLSKPTCRKITRSNLSILPRRSWNLANNSFLLHGYYNFHHLLLIENEDSYTLGVPGLYDKKEAHAADLFGFPLFSTSYLKEMDLSEDECCPLDNFGYWCRTIHKIK